MGSLAGFLMTMAAPLARQVLLSLGIGIVTYIGVDTALQALIGQAKSAWGGMSGTTAALIAIAGGNTALGILAGALVARLALVQLKRLMPK